MFHESGVGCYKPHFAISLPGSHLAVVDRPERVPHQPERAGRKPPPLYCRWCGTQWGGHVSGHVPYPVPPLWGSLPSNLSLREGFGQSSEHKPPTGAKLAEGKPHEMALSGPHLWRALLLRLGFHLAALSLARREPMLDLLLYHTPHFYIWMVRWYYVAPAAAVIVGGLFLISVWRVWFEQVGGNLTAIKLLPPWLLSADNDAGPGIVVGEVHHQAKSSCFHPHHPVQSRRNPEPEMAHYPGARTIHRSVNFRSCRVRQNLGLYAAVRTANLVLAGRQSPAQEVRKGGLEQGLGRVL